MLILFRTIYGNGSLN